MMTPFQEQDKNDQWFFVDGHVDLPYYMINHSQNCTLGTLNTGPFTLEKAAQSHVSLFCTAIYCEDRFNGESSFQHFQNILTFTRHSFDPVEIVNNVRKIESFNKSINLPATLLMLENADFLAGDLSRIQDLAQEGIQIVGLTHAKRNRLADGNLIRYSEGITKIGKEVIGALNRNGFAVDVAHLHPKCFDQLLDLFNGPILTTHTGIKNICNIPRNIDLNQAKEIGARNGMVGISFNPEMLSLQGEADIDQVFKHLDCLVQKLGPENAGFGSDFCGYDLVTQGLEDIVGIKKLMETMLAHGYGNEATQKIMGSNWLRFYGSI